jgi:3',5'-cyclic AMP phosphodiesterase CpdA
MFRHSITLVVLFLLLMSLSSCANTRHRSLSFKYQEGNQIKNPLQKNYPYPATRFLVFADLHYYNRSLGTEGQVFQDYLDHDRKLLVLSEQILDSAIDRINREQLDFILICGDLTKDGEKINHDYVAAKLKKINSTAKIYVIPGNHDVANGKSCRYTLDGAERVANLTPDEFRQVYGPFGYKTALKKDRTSLSYLAEPVAGLWVLALDSCLWRENKPGENPQTDGRFTLETLKWIEDVLIEAKQRKKAVIVFMHHGLMEHYPSNEKYYGDYVVDDSRALTDLLASYGVQLVFTGHFHAQDITRNQPDKSSRSIFDIETGSLITYPCPYRIVTITADQICSIESRRIEVIESMPTGFPDYARNYVFQGTLKKAEKALNKYMVSEEGLNRLGPQIAEAYLAHLVGDEKKPEVTITGQGTGLMGHIVLFFQKDLVDGWWTDLPPQDNRLVIDLRDGSYN